MMIYFAIIIHFFFSIHLFYIVLFNWLRFLNIYLVFQVQHKLNFYMIKIILILFFCLFSSFITLSLLDSITLKVFIFRLSIREQLFICFLSIILMFNMLLLIIIFLKILSFFLYFSLLIELFRKYCFIVGLVIF